MNIFVPPGQIISNDFMNIKLIFEICGFLIKIRHDLCFIYVSQYSRNCISRLNLPNIKKRFSDPHEIYISKFFVTNSKTIKFSKKNTWMTLLLGIPHILVYQ